MLRCGQMMLAQALICRHLGREKMCWSPPQSSSAAYGSMHSHRSALGRNKNTAGFCSGWKPLLLIIPLRLGINHINPIYIEAFKECFKMPQSLGALGGKPNNAYYFIGFLGNELIYLDPHTTQIFVDSEENGMVDDQSFHCQQAPHRMKIMNLDPSVALGFFCKEEKDFDNWCSLVQKEILKQQSLRMFELVQKHPPHWPPFIPPTKPEVTTTGAELIESTDKLFELEEEFEILSV
ncbi:cysteine protease ATG4A isoform X9 [Alligator sinensis]|nr:cysteine protease ATG4A isoform X9 [Alligator sinensis]